MQLPEHVHKGLVVLSPTRVQGGLRCMRRHNIENLISYQPDEEAEGTSPSLEFGTRMHGAVAMYWRGHDPGDVAEWLMQNHHWPLDAKHTSSIAAQCWASYAIKSKLFPMQSGPHNNWELHTLEERVVLPIEYSDVQLAFQIDRLVQCRDTGHLALVDLKTTRRVDSKWVQGWNRDLQMKLYAEAIRRKYGQAPKYVVIEAIDKSTCQYTAIPVTIASQSQLDEAWRQFLWVAHHDSQIIDSCTDGAGVVNAEKLIVKVLTETPYNTGECFAYGRPCPFLRMCDAEPEERIALLADGYKYVVPEWL